MTERICQARQMSDQMRCVPCGLVWDVNDPNPPECGRYDDRHKADKEMRKRVDEYAKTIRR